MIKNIVFDVGDVLVEFCYRRYMRNLGFSEETVEFLAQNMVLTEFWHQLDAGEKMEKEAVETFTAKYPQYKDEIISFWENIQGIVEEFDYALPLVKSLKERGYGVYVLSNYPVETAERHWPTFRFLPETDGHIISGFERLIKPDPRIYRLLESRFGLVLSECLFVDDRQVNIDGAEAVGMQGMLFKDPESFLAELREKGIADISLSEIGIVA